MRNAGDGGAIVQSVDRAASILDLLARRGWCGATDVARELGIHKATAFRLLATLQRRGLVERSTRTAKYRLGARLTELAGDARDGPDLRAAARPVCTRLAHDVGETVTLDLFVDGEVRHVEQATGSSSLVNVNWLGRSTPPHCTASGKVFLAYAPEEVTRAVLAAGLGRITRLTITDADELRRQLAGIAAAGFGHTADELEEGLSAVAAPVWGRAGAVVAAVNTSGPSHRLPRARIAALGAATARAAAEVSARLGAGS